MYGSISFDPATSQIAITPPFYSHLQTPKTLINSQVKTAMQDADNALRRIGMHETDSGDLFSDVINLNVVLRPEDKDFAISALAIHYCLPQNVQAQRVALFSTAWARYSPSFADQTQSRTQQLLAELVSKTLPTELIEPWTCINCRWLSLQFQRRAGAARRAGGGCLSQPG